MLQEILENDLFKSDGEAKKKVGRKLIKDKTIPECFVDYARKALKKLDLDDQKVIKKSAQAKKHTKIKMLAPGRGWAVIFGQKKTKNKSLQLYLIEKKFF